MGSIGFVPTMGALHEGHLSLVSESNKTCKNTVVSIYLNPTQFTQGEDLDSYPQKLQVDLNKLSEYDVDCVFTPNNSEMYPEGFKTNWLNIKMKLKSENFLPKSILQPVKSSL